MTAAACHKTTKMNLRNPLNGSAALDPSYTGSKLHEMATLMAKDNDFAVFRKFSELNFFNLLLIQHSLIDLEKKLCENLQSHLSVEGLVVDMRQLLKEYSE